MTDRKARLNPKPRDMSKLHPTVQFLFEEAAFQRIPLAYIQRDAKLAINSVYNWQKGGHPSVKRLDAALNVIGYTLAVVPLPEKTEA